MALPVRSRRRTAVHRLLAVAVVTTLVAVNPVVPAPVAEAAAPVRNGRISIIPVTAVVEADGGFDECRTDQDDYDFTSRPWAGTSRFTVSNDQRATMREIADPSQTATVRAWGTGTHSSVVNGGQLRSLSLAATLQAQLTTTFTPDSTCNAIVRSTLRSSGEVTVTRPGWATLRVQLAAPHGEGEVSLTRPDDPTYDAGTSLYEARGANNVRFFLARGTYDLDLRLSLGRESDPTDGPPKLGQVSNRMSASYEFNPAGAALGPAKGPGTARALLEASTGCSAGRVGIRWKRPARGAKQATVKVNGKTVRTVRNPKPGRRLVVGVPLDRRNTVTVFVGGRPTSRSYEACR